MCELLSIAFSAGNDPKLSPMRASLARCIKLDKAAVIAACRADPRHQQRMAEPSLSCMTKLDPNDDEDVWTYATAQFTSTRFWFNEETGLAMQEVTSADDEIYVTDRDPVLVYDSDEPDARQLKVNVVLGAPEVVDTSVFAAYLKFCGLEQAIEPKLMIVVS